MIEGFPQGAGASVGQVTVQTQNNTEEPKPADIPPVSGVGKVTVQVEETK